MAKKYGEEEKGTGWLPWLLLGGVVLLLGCCVLPVGVVAWNHVRERAAAKGAAKGTKSGLARVDLLWARIQDVPGQRFGGLSNYSNLLVIKVRVRNESATKLLRFGGWHGGAAVTDEHGNEYKPIRFPIGHQFLENPGAKAEEDADCETRWFIAVNEPIHPGKGLTCYLFHERPIAAANEVRVALDAKEVESAGTLRFTLPVQR